MKKIYIITIYVLASIKVVAQQGSDSAIQKILDSTFFYTQQTSLYNKKINWDSLRPHVYKLASNAKKIADLKPALTLLLNAIGDYHGRYFNSNDYSTLAYFTDWDKINATAEDKRARNPAVQKLINDTALHFSYQLINKTGYLKIVGMGATSDKNKEANAIRNAVIQLSKKKVQNWIIDLRFNAGGNMNPMMAGIAPLIGDGFVGYLSNFNRDTLAKWKIENNNFWWDNYQDISLPNTKKIVDKLPKIAVLTSRYTVSSGEFVANALKGRPNTKFFGEATGGYTTSTNWITIEDKLIICISSGIYCDRNGVMYSKNIPVDTEVEFNATSKISEDQGISEALKWLNKK
jgi:carboxyl-terminal processing protease